MRRALLLAILLAGCVAPSPAPDARPSAPMAADPGAAPIELTGCTVVEALAKMPPGDVAPFLPAGFEPSGDASGVFVILGAAACSAGGSRAYVAIQVQPTDEALRSAGASRYYWEPEHDIAPGGEFAARMLAMRANVTNATIEVANAATGAGARIAGDGWEHAIAMPAGGVAPGPSMVAAGVFREYFAADGGFGYLEAAFEDDPTAPFVVAPGMVSTGEGTTARDVMGASPTTLAGAGVLDYVDATVGFVPWTG